MDSIKQKAVIISGGLGDIGRAVARTFLQAGHPVAIGDLMPENEAHSIIEGLRELGNVRLHYTKCDSSNEREVENWLEAVVADLGMPQIIIANAGIVLPGLLTEDTSTTLIEKQFNTNFWSAYHLATQAAKLLKKKKLPGRMVFTGSWAAERPAPRIGAYCISKAAIRMLAKTLALELAEHRILVNELALGIVEGGLSKQNQQRDPELKKTHIEATPIHTLISPTEVALHIYRLCQFEHFSMTGNVVLIDGGLSLTSKMTK